MSIKTENKQQKQTEQTKNRADKTAFDSATVHFCMVTKTLLSTQQQLCVCSPSPQNLQNENFELKAVAYDRVLLLDLSVLLQDNNLPLLERIKSLCDANTVAVFV